MRQVTAGEALRIEANIWNRLVSRLDSLITPITQDFSATPSAGRTLMAKNSTGGDLAGFAVAQVDGVDVSPGTDLDVFQFEPVLTLTSPAVRKQWAITSGAIADGDVGPVYVTGVVPVQVNILHADHKFVQLGTLTTSLVSSTAGEGRIVYQAGSSGVVWCLVSLDAAATAMVPVVVAKTGGSAGDATTQCSFTYTVKDVTNTSTLATVQTPAFARPPAGKLVAATKGMAYLDAAGVWILQVVDEVEAIKVCPS